MAFSAFQEKIRLSVIVPVYGTEAYIERCAHSLFRQTLTDGVEFIFVNDGTPDRSMAILTETLQQYPNRCNQVKIINLDKNGGSANARHVALEQSSGVYICSCDSDDWVEADMFETLLNYAETHDADMVWCDFFRSDALGVDTYVRQDVQPEKNRLLGAYLSGNGTGFMGTLWNRICKKSLYESDFVYPPCDMTEDLLTVLQLTLNSHKIDYMPKAFYHYCLNADSICRTVQPEKVLKRSADAVTNANLMFGILEKKGLSGRYRREMVARKLIVKDALDSLLADKAYRRRWRAIYPETHRKILSCRYLPLKMRIRMFCIAYHCYWIYRLGRAVSRRF